MIARVIKKDGIYKTPRQVRRWLRRQPWYKDFRKFVMLEEDRKLRDKLLVLAGYYGMTTLIEAFDWSATLQGYNEWAARSRALCGWYLDFNYNSTNV